MTIKKIIIEEENGKDREISPGEIMHSLDPDKSYDFHLRTERGRPVGELHGVSSFDIVTYVSGVKTVREFHDKHRMSTDENKERYVVRIREAA